jgi:protein SCO1
MTKAKARIEKTLPRLGLATLQSAATLLLLSLVTLTFLGCSRENSSSTASSAKNAPAKKTARQEFQVRGVVQEVKTADKEVVIQHEEIPNYMPAMTMSFEVKNTNELAGLAANDVVSFRMVVTDDDGWIENLTKVGVSTNTAADQIRARTRLVREVEPLKVGDKMPNYPFTNSLGEKVELKDFAGQAYAFTFIFTRCPFPTFCPRMNMNFETVYKELTAMPNAPTNWHLLSISFDPEFDTPQRLNEYSATYNPDPKKWSWLTGAMIDIDAITEQLGLVFTFENNTYNHTLRTAVVDKNGVIRQIFWANEWTPQELLKELVAGAEGKEVGKY